MMMELIIMNVTVVLTGVIAITEVHTEMFTTNGGMKMMVLLMYLITATVEHVLLASTILMIGVVNVGMVMILEVVMNVMITQTTTIWSVILQIIIIIFIMEMIITMKLTTIM